MTALFKLERTIADEPRKKKEAVRDKKSRPLVQDFFNWCEAERDLVLDDSPSPRPSPTSAPCSICSPTGRNPESSSSPPPTSSRLSSRKKLNGGSQRTPSVGLSSLSLAELFIAQAL
jgi:hypothetical protein